MTFKNLIGKTKPYVLAAGLGLATLVGCGDNYLSKYNTSKLDLDSAEISFNSDWKVLRNENKKDASVLIEKRKTGQLKGLIYEYYAYGLETPRVEQINIINQNNDLLDQYFATKDTSSFHYKAIEEAQKRFDAYFEIVKKLKMERVDIYFK